MARTAIVTDTNSGITKKRAEEMGIFVIPMPFMIGEESYLEGETLTAEEFYRQMDAGAQITTSQPTPEQVTGMWDRILKEYEQIVHIPMSSALSGSCQTARLLAQDYEGKVEVVNNQRISITQYQSVKDACYLAREKGMDAGQIREFLEKEKFETSIYVMLTTLTYLKRGGRITPAAAALGNLLRLKPVLQIQGEKLDAFAKARTTSQGKSMMINAMKNDIATRFGEKNSNVHLYVAHSNYAKEAEIFKNEVQAEFPENTIEVEELSLSVSCHTGPGALALGCSKRIE